MPHVNVSADVIPSRVALIGYRCTGKTSVARILALKWGWRMVDLDRALMSRLQSAISDFVRRKGWPAFRRLEEELLAEFSVGERVVLATGGGIVERVESRRRLKNRFFTVWLTAGEGTIVERMARDRESATQRPPLTSYTPEQEVRVLLAKRRPWYEECARMTVSTEGVSPDFVAREVEKTVLQYGVNPSEWRGKLGE